MRKKQKELLTKMRDEIRRQGKAHKTEKAYMQWMYRLAKFIDSSLVELNKEQVVSYLNYLANERNVSSSTQNQALCAIVFFCKHIIEKDIGGLDGLKRAKKPKTLPAVLSQKEVTQLLSCIRGRVAAMVCRLMYGTGMRISEVLRLRVKDIDFDNAQIYVRQSKGAKDRTTILPESLRDCLIDQCGRVQNLHNKDLAMGQGKARLPKALAKKNPSLETHIGWQYLFPSQNLSRDPRTGRTHRHHISSSTIRKAFNRAARKTNITKDISPHTLRHTFATQLLQNGTDIRTLQELLGHKNLKSTMIYTHVTKKDQIQSPMDTIPV